ncbi:MAG: hypothetical protein UZ12_BCD005000767 [Bacteroidetes bacterium OLB12]|nr:MAG: hypothetical protein UZ12_BCD005000767 [Bacteroidetes bacterium OLB12]
MEKNQIHPDPESIIKLIKKAMNALLLLPVLVIALSVLILNADTIERKFISSKKKYGIRRFKPNRGQAQPYSRKLLDRP